MCSLEIPSPLDVSSVSVTSDLVTIVYVYLRVPSSISPKIGQTGIGYTKLLTTFYGQDVRNSQALL
jgi:hypothetical protein